MYRGVGFFFIVLIFFSCAQQNQPLSGGPKDTIAPKVIKSLPSNQDTGFFEEKIIIKFDEYVKLDGINEQFFSSPPFAENPKFKISGKKLIINFKEKLKDSVTYTLDFGNSIIDINEGNKLKNFDFVFSTYSELDSFKISGNIIDAYTFNPINEVVVFLYSKDIDSLPLIEMPLYATKVDSSGFFEFRNIKKQAYKIFTLLDVNGNFIFDKDENQIAFLDTLITPFIEISTQYDTLDSGTVVRKTVNDSLFLDTLRYDSISVSEITNYYPNDLNLLFYTEVGENQEIKRQKRTVKGGVKLFFTKKLFNNFIKLSPVKEDDNKIFDYQIEHFPSKDSVFVWFKNKEFYDNENDSLSFSIEYYLNDTVKVKDTLSFSGYEYATDSLPLALTKQKQNISIFEQYSFFSKNPIHVIDTNKIKLYKKIDTLVVDEKKQKVTVSRPAYDSLVFAFARPLTKTFRLEFKNEKRSDTCYYYTKNIANDTVFCKITKPSLIDLDTIKYTVYYDNLFFFNQLFNLEEEMVSPISFQKVKKIIRPVQDSIFVHFQNGLNRKTTIEILGFNENDFKYSIVQNIIQIKLNNRTAIYQDTLELAFSTPDMILKTGEEKHYNDTLKAIFVFDRQKVTYSRRYLRSRMVLAFKKPFLETPKLDLVTFKPLGNWYTVRSNDKKDTLFVSFHNERVKRLIDMKIAVKYWDINQHSDTLHFADTLDLKVKKIQDNQKEIVGREIAMKLNQPIPFYLNNDSTFIRKYNFDTKYEAGADYFIKIDSAAIKDIYGNVNDTVRYDFKVYSPEDFANLIIEIKNIWAILDSVSNIDTAGFYSLPKGQAILVVEDENGEIYKTKKFFNDKTLKGAMFLPGSYTLRMYYDENMNDKWDPGNYFKHKYPEKVFNYTKKVNLSEGVEEKIIWDLSDY